MFEFDYIITNGCIDTLYVENKRKEGWHFVLYIAANLVHPQALETDRVNVFLRYIGDR